MYTTYSFEDVSMVISHPAIGQYVANGKGLGSINTAMSSDRTAHELAADGAVMISKLPGRNGTHAIVAQQTSDLNKWLLRLYNYLDTAPASEWARISLTVRAASMNDLIMSNGVSFQKLADKPYQVQGQNITWNLMSADIQQF